MKSKKTDSITIKLAALLLGTCALAEGYNPELLKIKPGDSIVIKGSASLEKNEDLEFSPWTNALIKERESILYGVQYMKNKFGVNTALPHNIACQSDAVLKARELRDVCDLWLEKKNDEKKPIFNEDIEFVILEVTVDEFTFWNYVEFKLKPEIKHASFSAYGIRCRLPSTAGKKAELLTTNDLKGAFGGFAKFLQAGEHYEKENAVKVEQ